MNPEDLDRIRFVTRNFHRLQGLRRMVPVGLVTLGMGLLWGSSRLLLGLAASAGVGAFFLWHRARQFYLARCGEVEPQPTKPRDAILSGVQVVLILAFDLLAERGLYPRHLMVYAIFGVMFLLHLGWFSDGTRRYGRHYLILGVLFAGLAIPSPSIAVFLPGLQRPGFDFILSGLAVILAGLLDHQLLVRSLSQVPAPFAAATAEEIES